VLVLEVALARGVSGPQISKYVYLFVGLYVVAFVFRFPLATALAFFFFTDFLFAATKFSHQVGSITVRPAEVALACLFLLAVLRPKKHTWGGRTGAGLAAFLAILALSGLVAVSSHTTNLSNAFNWGRPLALLAFFWIVIRLFPEPEDRRKLMTGIAVLAAVTGLATLLISMGAGFGNSLKENGGVGELSGEEGTEGVQRIRLAGLSACYALFWYTVVQIIGRKGLSRLLWSGLLGGMLLAIVLSYNRNMWLGIVIGAVFMAVVGGVMVRSRMAIGLAVLVGGLGVLLLFGSTGSGGGSVVTPLIKRGSTILNPGKTEKESSLQARDEETAKAWKTARHHLALGVGPGVPFGVYDSQAVVAGEVSLGEETNPQLFLHDQYIYLILICGIPGLLAFLFFVLTPLVDALRRAPRDPAITACAVGIAIILVSSVVAIYLTVPDMTALLGLLTGVIVADKEGRAADGKRSGLLPEPEPSDPEGAQRRTSVLPRALNAGLPAYAPSKRAAYRSAIVEELN
jgi:O-antigen ligase